MEIPIATAVSIREAGFNEYWLQEQIYQNPTCLKLGDLESVSKERIQSSGGRLDILLKNPEEDSMYEVEIMLGETDESHIIRTIEYWDNEKRRWPQRQHYAVLVAESLTRRFFNVIQLLSHSIPIIAVQVNMIESGGHKALHFAKVLDTYEEPDDGTGDGEVYDETYWNKKAPRTVEVARRSPFLGSGSLTTILMTSRNCSTSRTSRLFKSATDSRSPAMRTSSGRTASCSDRSPGS